MSELLALAKSFEQTSKQQASDTKAVLKADFERHNQFISEALRSSEQRTSAAIQEQNQRLRDLALKGWVYLGLSAAMLLTVAFGALWWTGEQIAANVETISTQEETISTQEQTIKKLNRAGGFIQWSQCGDQLCVKIDKNAQEYENGYRVVDGG